MQRAATLKQAALQWGYCLLICSLFGLILGGCGQRYHLNRAIYHTKQAARHKTQAISKGAKLDLDTTWQRIKLKTPPVEFSWEPKLPVEKIFGDTTLAYSHAVVSKSTGKKVGEAKVRIIFKDRIIEKIVVDCPEQEVEADVATKVEESLIVQPKFNFWHGLLTGITIGISLLLFLLLRRWRRSKEKIQQP